MIECFVLVGGESRRFGEDKTLFPIKGKRCVEYVVDALKCVCDEVFLVGKDPSKYFSLKGVKFVKDAFAEQGALIGIYTALRSAKTDRILVVGADMPLIKPPVVRHLLDNYREPITIYCVKGKLYPLFGVYARSVLKDLEVYIQTGNKKVIEFIKKVGYHCITEEEVLRFDPELQSFINMNTKEDLQTILKIMSKIKLKVSGMTCEHCASTVRKALLSVEGVEDAKVSLEKGEAEVVTYKDVPLENLKNAVEEWGYKVVGEV
jgi:molybdopterin-guanine dinucleotide biosynthesis protein A